LKEQQKEQLDDQQFYTYLAIVAVLITSLIIFVLYINQRKVLNAHKTISEQKAEIESQNAELEAQAEYLRDVNALKDRLLSIIGHDLKTPINQIKGILPILEMGGLTKEDFQYISGGITQNLTHASDLLDNLFRWALSQLGGEMLKAQTFDLKVLIDSNIELYAPIAEKKEILVTNVSLYKMLVWADIDMIDLVIRNLLSNSLKFCLPKSDIMFFVTEQDTHILVCVQDTGIGIAPEILPTLFGEGHESKRGTAGEKGTGLGLTLCRDFVTKNGGNIWVESTVGVGSKFYFTVPKDKNSV
jgi:signal transduction histidine kinase